MPEVALPSNYIMFRTDRAWRLEHHTSMLQQYEARYGAFLSYTLSLARSTTPRGVMSTTTLERTLRNYETAKSMQNIRLRALSDGTSRSAAIAPRVETVVHTRARAMTIQNHGSHFRWRWKKSNPCWPPMKWMDWGNQCALEEDVGNGSYTLEKRSLSLRIP